LIDLRDRAAAALQLDALAVVRAKAIEAEALRRALRTERVGPASAGLGERRALAGEPVPALTVGAVADIVHGARSAAAHDRRRMLLLVHRAMVALVHADRGRRDERCGEDLRGKHELLAVTT
jgi:hypothetical protein